MALTDLITGGSSGTFVDGAGNNISWTSTGTHSSTNDIEGISTAALSPSTHGYTFDDGSGGGANGIALQVGGLAYHGIRTQDDEIDLTLNGVDVNINDLITNGDAYIVDNSHYPSAWTSHTPGQNDATIDADGNIVATSAGNPTDMLVLAFNVPVSSLSFQSASDATLSTWTDIYLDSEAAICFTRDTMIDTDQGEVAVQDLEVGMMVRTRDNGMQPVRWIGMKPTKDRAVRIKAGAMGNTRDLVVSPRHRMVLDGWQLQMLFDHDHALVTALELVNDDTIVRDAMTDVEYYHVMFDQHEVIYAEGAATESFHPDQASMGSMDAASREEIFTLFPELRDGSNRDQAAPNLSATQAAYVGKNVGEIYKRF